MVPRGQLTQYYVRHFKVDDPTPFQLLTLRLKRDDGAAVYVNGIEVVRNNLPAGTLTATTFPSSDGDRGRRTTWRVHRSGRAARHRRQRDRGRGAPGHAQQRRLDLRPRARPQDADRDEPADPPVVTLAERRRTRRSRCSWTAATDDAGVARLRRPPQRRARRLHDRRPASPTPASPPDARTPTRSSRSTPPATRRRRARSPASTTGSNSSSSSRRRLGLPLRRRSTRAPLAPARLRRLVVGLRSVPARLGRPRGDDRRSRAARSPQYYVRHFVAPDPSHASTSSCCG